MLGEEIAEKYALRRKAFGERVVWKKIHQFILEGRKACRLKADERGSGFDLGSQRGQSLAPQSLGYAEPSPIVQGAAAAERALRDRDLEAGGFERVSGGDSGFRTEIGIEGVGPEQDAGAVGPAGCAPRNQAVNGSVAKGGSDRSGAMPAARLAALRRAAFACKVRGPWKVGGAACQPVDPAHRVGVPRPWAPSIMVRSELCLVTRHVDIDRAVAFTAFAGEAEIQGLFDLCAAPAIVNRPAMKHLEQESRATARRISLFMSDEIAWAHHLVVAVVPSALSDADAALRRPIEAALLRKLEVRLQGWRLIARPNPKIGRDRIRIDDFARDSCIRACKPRRL